MCFELMANFSVSIISMIIKLNISDYVMMIINMIDHHMTTVI